MPQVETAVTFEDVTSAYACVHAMPLSIDIGVAKKLMRNWVVLFLSTIINPDQEAAFCAHILSGIQYVRGQLVDTDVRSHFINACRKCYPEYFVNRAIRLRRRRRR